MVEIILGHKLFKQQRDEFPLNRFEPTSVMEWEECVIVAGSALPQLVESTIFQPDYASFFLRVVIWEPLGSFIMTIWMSQPGTLATPICAISVHGWCSCGDGDGCIYIGQKCLFHSYTTATASAILKLES